MRNIKLILFSVGTVLILCGVSFAKDWHGIIPLRSTRQDVEQKLGLSSYGGGYAYETEDERVFFTYFSGECNDSETWKVPRDTVVMIIAYPKTRLLLSNLQIDPKKYKKTNDCNPGSFHYTDKDEGISYAVDGDVVSEILYYPKREDERLVSHCRSNLPN